MKFTIFLILFFQVTLFANTNKVLFISSYNASFPTISKQLNGIKKVLPEAEYQIDIEYMDTKRFSPHKVEPLFLSQLIMKKELLQEYDVILVGDDNALHFVQKYQNKLFHNKPIIFLAINNELYAQNISKDNFITGVIEKQSVTATLNLIHTLHPKSSKIFVITDTTTTSDAILNSFSDNDLSDIEFLSLKKLSFQHLRDKLNNLPSEQPLLYVSAMADKNGDRKEFYQSIEFIKESGDLPLYHLYEHGIGEGMIGGKVVMFSKQGEIAAKMAKQIIEGTDVKVIKYIPESKNHYFFDYNEILKYKINQNLLPKDSIIINKPILFIQKHFKIFLWATIATLSIMLMIILTLLLKSRKNFYQLKKTEKELSKAFENVKKLLNLQDNIVILSDGKTIKFANQKFFEFLGFKDLNEYKKYHDCIGEFFIENERFFHLAKIDKKQNWLDELQKLSHSEKIVSMLGKDFKPHAFSVTTSNLEGNLVVISFTDISQTMLEYIKMEEKTIHDNLTEAFNREFFEQNIARLIFDYNTDKTSLAIALLDIDYFKLVNDTYGHDVGDKVLIHFVKTIQKFSRDEDILIRWGGEEFILILRVNSKENLYKALDHLRKTIEIEEFPSIGQLTCSVGGAIYQKDEDIQETIKRADEAVYDAKASGRNRICIM